jgi:hypothetical protein
VRLAALGRESLRAIVVANLIGSKTARMVNDRTRAVKAPHGASSGVSGPCRPRVPWSVATPGDGRARLVEVAMGSGLRSGLIRTRPIGPAAAPLFRILRRCGPVLAGSAAGSGTPDRSTVTTIRSEQDREGRLPVRMWTIMLEFCPKPAKPSRPERSGSRQ